MSLLKSSSIFLLCGAASALADDASVYSIKVEWKNPSTLNDHVVMQCDDTYYSVVRITVPGSPNKNYSVQMDADVTSGTPKLGCTVSRKAGRGVTIYEFDASNGGCTIEINRFRSQHNERQKAVYELHDAC